MDSNLKITPIFIKKTVEKVVGIEDLSSKNRSSQYALNRFVAFKLSKEFLGGKQRSSSFIGKVYGRDHATVLHGLKEFEKFKSQSFYKPYLDNYILSKGILNLRKSFLDSHLKKIHDFNKTNNDKDLKKSIDVMLKFMMEI